MTCGTRASTAPTARNVQVLCDPEGPPRGPTRAITAPASTCIPRPRAPTWPPAPPCRNRLLTGLRAEAERGIAVLKTRWKALDRIRLCPRRIGAIAAAALV